MKRWKNLPLRPWKGQVKEINSKKTLEVAADADAGESTDIPKKTDRKRPRQLPAQDSAATASAASSVPEKKKRRRQPAALAAGPSQHLDTVAQAMATTRPSSRRSLCDEDVAAVRLRAGRTLDNFLSLLQCGLFHTPPTQCPGTISPLPGLYAKLQGNHVIILEYFTWRGVGKVDVVPLVEQHGPNGSTHTIKKREVETCDASALKDVGFHFHFLGTVQKKPLFRARDPDEDFVLGPQQHALGVGRHCGLQPSNPATLCLGAPPEKVTPQKALMHAESHRHTVTVKRMGRKILCDMPWPKELETPAYRCSTCALRHLGAEDEPNYFAVTESDIVRVVPEAIPMRTVSWLHSFYPFTCSCAVQANVVTIRFSETAAR
jgi:hypothetical protein